MKYLLDANIVSALMVDPWGGAAARQAEVGDDNVFTSIIVVAEMRFGIEKRQSRRLADRLDGVLSHLSVLPFEAPADSHYASIRVALERIGRPIGERDTLIAAHARALGATLVTANEREFARVPGLSVENWLR